MSDVKCPVRGACRARLSIGDTGIGDGVGNTIISALIDGGINVESKTSVPEPSSLSLLFVLGVGLMLLERADTRIR